MPMGLMVIFPVSEDETDRIEIKNLDNKKTITLKSYGLPLIFWGYLAAIILLIIIMYLATKAPLIKLYETNDVINQIIALAAAATLFLIPVVCLFFYFYEKMITKSQNDLIVTHKFFWIPFLTKKYTLASSDSFIVEHFMDSPNVAKMQSNEQMKGFENKGYFQLFFKTADAKILFLDRHSRKADLEKMKVLLSRY